MERLKEKIEKLERDYKYSARRFGFLNQALFIPSIAITSLSSIFSFMSSSNFVSPENKNICILIVAILTSLATMLQTINSSCEYSVKKTKFIEASQKFNMLSDKIFFEMVNENEKDFIDTIEKEIQEIKNQCKFLPLEAKQILRNDYIQLN